MNKEETKRALVVMEAWVNGCDIQIKPWYSDAAWQDTESPTWNWDGFNYRVKPVPVNVQAWAVISETGDYKRVFESHPAACIFLSQLCSPKSYAIVELKGEYLP